MKQHWRSNSSFINFVRHIRQLLWVPSLLHCFVLCLVGDCGKIVIFAIFAKFAAFANFYGPPSLLRVLPRWRLWQNCHFRHICQIRQHYLFFAIFVVVCISGHISRSSAKTLSLTSHLPTLIPLMSLFSRILILTISRAIINRYGDKGSPWRTKSVYHFGISS